MTVSKAAREHMRKVFTESFSVSDIAESLVSFDATTSSTDVQALMVESKYEVVGIRQEGLVTGYVKREELGEGTCGDHLHEFEAGDVVSELAGLPAVVASFDKRRRLFVTSFGQVAGIVTKSDLQKPPVRMWLFGMVTTIEMGFMRLIESKYADDGWKEYVSEARLQKAEELLAERRRRNQDLALLDCLQFSDKGQIIIRNEELRDRVGFVSRRRGVEAVKRIEALRNGLAHSQDIISHDWDTIGMLAGQLDRVLAI